MFSYVFLAFESNSAFILASVLGVFTHRIFLFQPSSFFWNALLLLSFLFFPLQKIEKKTEHLLRRRVCHRVASVPGVGDERHRAHG